MIDPSATIAWTYHQRRRKNIANGLPCCKYRLWWPKQNFQRLKTSSMFLERSYSHPKLADAEKVSEKVASDWLQKQALLLVYLSAPLHITWPNFHPKRIWPSRPPFLSQLTHRDGNGDGEAKPTTDTLWLPLTLPEAIKTLNLCLWRLKKWQKLRIYTLGSVKWPKCLQVDPEWEFMNAVSKPMKKLG